MFKCRDAMRKRPLAETNDRFFVGVLGFEPRMTGPESVVLPLHHTPIAIARQRYEVFMNGAPDGTKK